MVDVDEMDVEEVVTQVRALHDAGRAAMLADIRAELEDAVNSAASDDAPAEGDETCWGKADYAGLQGFLEFLDANY